MEREKYAIINSCDLTRLFTSSCVTGQSANKPHIYSGKCGLIKSRHVGHGKDRLLIVKNNTNLCQDTPKNPVNAITPITQTTEQAKSQLLTETSTNTTSDTGVVLVSAEGSSIDSNIESGAGSCVKPETHHHISRKRKPTQQSSSKVKGKRSKVSNRKHIRDLLT